MDLNFKKLFSSLQKVSTEQSKKVVGIDFGSSSVKVVELEMREGVIALTTYGELQLGPYAELGMGDAAKLPLQKRIQALVDVLRESGVEAKSGVLSLPLSDSFVTIMSLSAKEDEDITPRVHVEARKYIPVPIADVTLEWSEIEQQGTNKQPALTREVLLAAIQNEALTEMKSILNSVEMASQPSEIELFSALRAVAKEDDGSLAILDIGASICKLYVIEAGYLRRIHRVQSGGVDATKAIAKQLGISFEDAENIKRNYKPDSQHAALIKKVMASTFERTFLEFKRVTSQYELRTGSPISRIVLTGGSVSFPDVQSYASYAFDREVEITNPFTKVAYPAFMEDTIKEIAPIFTVALGAALRSFEQ